LLISNALLSKVNRRYMLEGPTMDLKALHRSLAQQQSQMLSALQRLVECESPSSDKAAVDRCGALLKQEFERSGARVSMNAQPKFGDHLLAEFAGEHGKPVMLLGHFDTVWDLGTLKTMPWRVDKGRAFGPGAYDMKTGIVQMLFAIAALREANGGTLPRPVRVWLVTDEEVGSDSSRAMTEKLAKESAAVFVCEPSQGPTGALKTARKGVGEYTVKVQGIASHSGVDFEKGQSAIVELARQITRISSFTELKRGITVNPGVICGGTRTNVIAAEAAVDVDVRIAKMKDAALVDKKFGALKPFNKKCKLEVTGGVNRPPMERTPGVAALYKQAQQVAKELGFKIEEKSTGGGSDGNFTAGLGIPTLDGMGAVGEGAHAVNESIVISELPRRTALLTGIIAKL
jgi:glutamate carboxypeptidase